MPETVILDTHFRKRDVIFAPEQLARMRAMADVVWARDEPMPAEEAARHADSVAAIITGGWRYGAVQQYPTLRAVLEVSGGFPSQELLDYPYCFAKGIRVLSCAPGFAPAVAEMALGLAIAVSRGIAASDAAFRTGQEAWGTRGTTVEDALLYDKPVGFIGFGSLARRLKELLAPFRCPIRAYDPWLTDAYLRRQGVTPASLDEVLSEPLYVFVLAVPTAGNRALLDREKLERIRRDAVLLLMSRSHLVDFDALTEMLLEGRFRAAIDVFPEEPLPLDHPIRHAPGVVLSPHRAGGGLDTYRFIGDMVLNDLEAILTGRVPQEMQLAQPEYIRGRG